MRANTGVGVLAFLLLLIFASGAARADDTAPLDTKPPSVGWLVGGIALTGLGLSLHAQTLHAMGAERRHCTLDFGHGCYWSYVTGSALELLGGGALITWSWKLGAHHQLVDANEGFFADQATIRNAGMALGGIAYLVKVASTFYTMFWTSNCPWDAERGLANEDVDPCRDRMRTGAWVDLLTIPPVVVGSLMAGYGLGYGSVLEAPVRVAPTASRGAAGLTLMGVF